MEYSDHHPILIFGATGQVGRALTQQLGERAVALSSTAANFAEPLALSAILDKMQPGVVINAAAYTQVDRAEQEQDLALTINATAPEILAQWCAVHQIPFIHYSTDYVYSGEGHIPWNENSPVAPLNAYGRTKLAGDRAIIQAGGKWLILRTSWVYDALGKNFFNTIIKLSQEREILKIVADQYGSPTYAPDLAAATLTMLASSIKMAEFPSGIYHYCNSGETNWYEFALAILTKSRELGLSITTHTITPITTNDYPTPARRPLNSRLDLKKLHKIFNLEPPHWQTGLSLCLTEKYQLNQ